MRGVSVGHAYKTDFAAFLEGAEMREVVEIRVVGEVPGVVCHTYKLEFDPFGSNGYTYTVTSRSCPGSCVSEQDQRQLRRFQRS